VERQGVPSRSKVDKKERPLWDGQEGGNRKKALVPMIKKNSQRGTIPGKSHSRRISRQESFSRRRKLVLKKDGGEGNSQGSSRQKPRKSAGRKKRNRAQFKSLKGKRCIPPPPKPGGVGKLGNRQREMVGTPALYVGKWVKATGMGFFNHGEIMLEQTSREGEKSVKPSGPTPTERPAPIVPRQR